MVPVLFTCSHPKTVRVRYTLNGQTCLTQKESLEKEIAALSLPAGPHVLTVTTKSWYDTPLCYFQVLNPFFYAWHIKFLSCWHLGYDDSFSSTRVSFSLKEKQETAHLTTRLCVQEREDINGNMGSSLDFYCQKSDNIRKLKIEKVPMPQELITRFRRVHLLSAIFYGIILDTVFILGCLNAENIIPLIVAALFCTMFSANMIIKTAQTKSVHENMKKTKHILRKNTKKKS